MADAEANIHDAALKGEQIQSDANAAAVAMRKAAQDAAKWNQETMQQEEAASVKTLTDAGYTMTAAKAEEAEREVLACVQRLITV